MSTTEQPEALQIAATLEALDMDGAADAVRRLHAENTTLRQGYDAARLEIESLRAGLAENRATPETYEARFKHHDGSWTPFVPLGAGLRHSEVEIRIAARAQPIISLQGAHDVATIECLESRVAYLEGQLEAARAQAAPPPLTEQQAHDMGAKGAPATDAERLLFEAWMRGHCWALSCSWDGKSYRSDAEHAGYVDPRAANTRQLWAAWRDRAALATQAAPAAPAPGVPSEDVKAKIASNTWDHFGDILPTLKAISRGDWYWGANSRCKYIEIRIDTRDGGCILYDRDRVRISPEQFAFQAGGGFGKMDPWPAANSLGSAAGVTAGAVPVTNDDEASAFLEATLWEFIDMAAAFPRAKPDPRTWPHVLVYAPKADSAPAAGAAPGRLEDHAQIRCRKCGEMAAIEFNSARIVTHNPFTGKKRDERDVASDPEGKLMVGPNATHVSTGDVENIATTPAPEWMLIHRVTGAQKPLGLDWTVRAAAPKPPAAAQEPFGWACWIGSDDNNPTRAQFSAYEPLAYQNRVELYTHPAPQQAAPAEGDALDAKRYRQVRRGQHWSVVDGIGNDLRAEVLDAVIDAALAAQKEAGNG